MLLGIWFITSGIVVCCTLCGVCCAGSGGDIDAGGAAVGLGCIMLTCVICALGTLVTCSSLLSMRYGCVSCDGVVVLLMLDKIRNYTGTFFLLPCIACMYPVIVALELGGYFRN